MESSVGKNLSHFEKLAQEVGQPKVRLGSVRAAVVRSCPTFCNDLVGPSAKGLAASVYLVNDVNFFLSNKTFSITFLVN